MATVQEVATARGRTVEEVLAACRSAGVVAWSAHTPLDAEEVAALDARLEAPAPPPPPLAQGFAPIGATGGPPPPPPTGSPINLPPPPFAGAPGFRMPAGTPPAKRSHWVRIAVVAGAVALVAGRIGLNVVFNDVGDDIRRDHAADEVREVLGADFDDDVDEGLASFALVEGDCFDDRSDVADDPTEIVDARLDEVDCALPHDAEVYALVEHPDPVDAPYAGDSTLVFFAGTECSARFDAFVGAPYDTSSLDFMFVFPTSDVWTLLDDRTVVCAVYAFDGSPLTGSVAGTGI